MTRSGNLDAIVIGGGHNGLTCAAYLARAGRSVLVLEARPLLGGFATTETPFDEYPDVRSSMTSLDLVAANLPPSVIDDLDLASHGLVLQDMDPVHAHLSNEGDSILFWRDLDRTCREIAKFSSKDAESYRRLTRDFIILWRTAIPYFQANPLRPGLATLARMAGAAFANPPALGRALKVLQGSALSTILGRFEHPTVRAALGIFAAASGNPLDQPDTGMALGLLAMQHEWGSRRPVGGTGAFSDALHAAGAAAGVDYRTDSAVAEVLLSEGKAAGVRLESGEIIRAPVVIGALDPVTLISRLLPSAALSAAQAAEIEAIAVFASNIAAMRVDLLIEGPPRLPEPPERAQQILPSASLIGPSSPEAINQYLAGCTAGRLGDDMPIWAALPTLRDRSYLPEGSPLEIVHVYVPAVPYEFADGASWDGQRDAAGQKVLKRLTAVMPGLAEQVRAISVRTPADLARTSRLTKGCLYHADMSSAQMGPNRPTRSLAGYRTPFPGLWHTGAGAHPMGGINGISGRLAAEAVLRS